ncbi:hypothetical protein EUGRSUZ_J00946 [Eucalyptus grandis]|uniref:Uncharacterized protein n=2 Tax=Eucalyptus grandis TaxID=71139 RepID=A0ACC3J4Z7_EUCGR|nr:hypothetical protein EUGRSUZ_J00946 [Eucalyptus grandis]
MAALHVLGYSIVPQTNCFNFKEGPLRVFEIPRTKPIFDSKSQPKLSNPCMKLHLIFRKNLAPRIVSISSPELEIIRSWSFRTISTLQVSVRGFTKYRSLE